MTVSSLEPFLDLLEGAHIYSDYIVARCAFHDDRSPSLMIHKDTYKCLSCGAFGYTDKLLAKLSKTDVKYRHEEWFINPFTTWLKKFGSLGKALKAAHHNIRETPSKYLADRGINEFYQKELRLGYMDDWYTFPAFGIGGKIDGAIARKSPTNLATSRYVCPKNQSPLTLYCPSWELVLASDHVFIVFGIIDAVTLYTLGYASISSTCGTSVRPEAFQHIRKRLYIWPDRGEEKYGATLAAKFGWRGKIVKCNWPNENMKDVNDLYLWDKEFLKNELGRFL